MPMRIINPAHKPDSPIFKSHRFLPQTRFKSQFLHKLAEKVARVTTAFKFETEDKLAEMARGFTPENTSKAITQCA